MKRVVTLVGIVGLLGGCASSQTQSPWLMSRGAAIPMACAPLPQEQELTLNLAQRTADEGRLHAALANLERLPSDLPQARLYKARILRALNRPEARELYAGLVNTCLKAQGEHGLGQLASAQGKYEEALKHLRQAASLDPTSDTIRNDLGVVYMNLGRMDEARFELLTSLELNEAEKQPALNLLALLIYQGQRPQASALAERMGFSVNQFRAAEQRAQALRNQLSGVVGATPAQPVPPTPAPRAVQRPPVVVTPLVKPTELRAVPAPVPVVKAPATPPTLMRTPPAPPAPKLSNFRPIPVVPLSVASAAAKPPAAPVPTVAPATAAQSPTVPAVATQPATAVQRQVAAVPRVVSKPVLRAPVAPVLSSDASAVSTSIPVAVSAGQGRAAIEMRPGRLIVSEDGDVVRVEPISGAQAEVINPVSVN